MGFRHLSLFAVLTGFSVAIYAGPSTIGGSAGFPLDDAWIHQTYARNLAESGQLAYVSGQPSAGSTAPLWTLLIAIGYKLNVGYRLWTYALGAGSLALCGWFVSRLSLRLWPDRPRLALAAGLLCLFEWRLAWAAASGMETVLFAALGLALIERAARSDAHPSDGLIFGVLGGLLTLTRPEGLLLVALASLTWLARSTIRSQSLSDNLPNARRGLPNPRHADGFGNPSRSFLQARLVTASLASFAILVLPAAWLNLQASGTLFPNTFYAKQQEYAVYFSSVTDWLPRALDVIGAPFVGAQVLLAPGFVLEAFLSLRALRDRSTWARALPSVWVAAHLAAYAARLPVTYQHGRYLIPVIPVILLVGLHVSARLIERIGWFRHLEMPPTVLRRVAAGSLIGAAAAFWIVGAGAYRVDVNIIESELVASARWIQANTPPGALIAAHDIGAIGYFARRPLLDLAGLISPEVIPIIRDEASLLALMRARGADFFAAPPDFYSTLLDAPELEQVFKGTSPFAPKHWLVFRAVWQSP